MYKNTNTGFILVIKNTEKETRSSSCDKDTTEPISSEVTDDPNAGETSEEDEDDSSTCEFIFVFLVLFQCSISYFKTQRM